MVAAAGLPSIVVSSAWGDGKADVDVMMIVVVVAGALSLG
jgi:hypothetical protein